MNYELTAALKTLRKEGVGSLFKKLSLYTQQIFSGARFKRPGESENLSLDAVLDFSFNAAGGLIRAGQVRSELRGIAAIVQELKPKTVLEIGTATGGTLFVWCVLAHPEATVVSIDLPGGIHGGGYPYWKTFLYRKFKTAGQRLHLLRGSSHDPKMLSSLRAFYPGPIDFLFIDGDHTYAGVKEDYEMYGPLVRKGGVIAFHDICVHPPELDCHVDEFWNEIKQGRKYQELIEDATQGWGGIGVIYV